MTSHPSKGSTAGRGMRLTERDRKVVAAVVDFGVISRAQLVHLGHFGSKTRANAVLARLARFGYLTRRYQPAVAGTQKALYLPGRMAAELLGRPSKSVEEDRRRIAQWSDLFLTHQLLVNDLRLSFSADPRFRRWLSDAQVRRLALGVIADGYIEYEQEPGQLFAAFVELDRGTETLERFASKVRAYLSLAASGKHREVFGRQYFRVLVVAPNAGRLMNLIRTTAKLTERVFWFAELPGLQVDGPFSKLWLRPTGRDRHELTES